MNEHRPPPKIQRLLHRVTAPARYVGNELNSVVKDFHNTALKLALAFPDLYEVGMSNLGLRILYDIVNSREEMLAERVFAPAADMEKLLREEKIPLFSLENYMPLRSFDIIGFSLQYELTYTNVLNMLDLADIPLRSADRDEHEPLIIGGGVCAFNPEPVAPFFDLFVVGDGEEVLPELLEVYRSGRDGGLTRKKMLLELAQLEGVYVPSFYRPCYEAGNFTGIEPAHSQVPSVIEKRLLHDLNEAPHPTAPIVPFREIVHDRAIVEISRGCVRGCRFCQAGTTYRPRRTRSVEKIRELALSLIENTGYDELSLASLSSSDYPHIEQLVKELGEALPPRVNLSLPSLRMDSFSVRLAAAVQGKTRGSLTFAPEAGNFRLRRAINKNISDESLFQALEHAFRAGWRTFKLYYMIGLPTETDDDVLAIARQVEEMFALYRRLGCRGRLRLTVSTSTFTPKAHTPFQWEPQITPAETHRRQQLLARSLKQGRSVQYKWHDRDMSFMEAVFSRGDRRLADVLERAWAGGCKFDHWSDHFNMDRWLKAFDEAGIAPADYALRRYELEDPLPWEHLRTGLKKEFLIKEYRKSLNGI